MPLGTSNSDAMIQVQFCRASLAVQCVSMRSAYLGYSKDGNLLLLEISPVLFVHQHKIEIVACAELLIHVSECRSEFEPAQEEPYGYCFSAYGCPVHDFEFGDGFALVVLVWHGTCSFPTNNRQFHVFDLDADQKEIDLSNNDIFQVVSCLEVSDHQKRPKVTGDILGLVVLELDMQAILNADLHLDGIIAVGRHPVRVHP